MAGAGDLALSPAATVQVCGGGEGEHAFILLLLTAGWTRDCLLDWGSFIRLAVPGMLMMCIEWWTFEIGSFLAGESKSSFSSGSAGHLPAIPALVAAPVSPEHLLPAASLLQGWF